MPLILIADSGSTKTTWYLYDRENDSGRFILTSGINPYYQDEQEITGMLVKEFTTPFKQFEAIYFYGAGCANSTVNQVVCNTLSSFFQTAAVEVESDLMGAARSLCGYREGIACILGTGSNSCAYDGKSIVQTVFATGFIFGDPGSGSELGKKLLADVLQNQLPKPVISRFFEKYRITPAEIMDHVYHQPFPNRFTSRFTRFIHENLDEPELESLVRKEFTAFFRRNVFQYPKATLVPVHFTGGIAWHFRKILEDVAVSLSLHPGKIKRDPINGLVEYHLRSE